MSQDIYKMFSSQYSKKISLLSQQTGERYGKKKSSRTSKKLPKKKIRRKGRHSKAHKAKKFSRGQGKPI
jgi:hypothetical protein